MSVTMGDFHPCNEWIPEENGLTWMSDDTPMFVVDQTTHRKYWNDTSEITRIKHCGLILGTLPIHAVVGIGNIFYRAWKLISCAHFTAPTQQVTPSDNQEKPEGFKNAAHDCCRIALQPIAIVGLEAAACYGCCCPNDGMKLYATIERAEYEEGVLAPCFQPDPDRHLFNGNPNLRNQF